MQQQLAIPSTKKKDKIPRWASYRDVMKRERNKGRDLSIY